MYYTTTKVGKPTAHITKKKSRLKVYNGNTVFLGDKDNFEFEIHNPTQKSVLCKIKLNGEYISTSGVVIKPGQRVFLERFLDTNNKFEFSTYEVKDTSENKTAIDLNGDVRIEFYNEQSYNQYPHLSGGNWGDGWTNITTGSPYYGDMTFTTSNSSPMSYYNNTSSVSNTIETGRVEKGEKSKQQFTNSYQNFEYNASRQIIFKILPLGIKNKTTDDIKHYCTECGTKTKSKYKFCPSCGYDLNSKKETIIRYTDDVNEIINGKNYMMSTFNLSLSKLIEIHSGKTIIIHKPSLSEDNLRAIIL
jgi:ribosomal protein L37E